MCSRSVLALLLALSSALPAAAQAPEGRSRTVAGVCGATNWVCVAECIDAECVDRCLREGCERALDRLKACTRQAGCPPEDTQCAARTCERTCQRAFEPAPPSPEQEREDPCAGQAAAGAQVPQALVGTWTLSAASLPDREDGTPQRIEMAPRSDYARTLQVSPSGCFVLRTALEEATLGRGNALVIRGWGILESQGEARVVLRTRDGQAVGPVCGDKRVIPLTRGRFLGGRFRWDVEEDTLTLTRDDETKQTFQFERRRPPAKEGGG